ncbi:MAG: S8 family serine peptidase [Halobacteriales archaeon]
MRRRISRGIAGGIVAAFLVLLVVGMMAVPVGGYAPAERSPAAPGMDRSVGAGGTNETTAAESTSLSVEVRELVAAARAGRVDSEFVSRSGDGILVTVTVEATAGRGDDAAELLERHGTVTSRFGDSIDAALPPGAVERIAGSPAVASIGRPAPVVSAHQGSVVSEGLSNVNVSDELHASGVNGSNVTVAVVDTGFDVNNDEIDHHVAGFRDFEGDGMDNASGLHGTAVAEIVVDTAPNVSLLLYEVETSTGMGAAIDHITRNTSADVASMSLGLLTGPFDGTSRIDGAIENSVANGTTWFVSAGNYADGQHYNQTWQDGDGDGWMDVSGSRSTIEVDADGGSDVYVSWSGDDASSQDYDVYLNDSGEVIDVSNTTQNGSQRPTETVGANESGNFTLAIEEVDAKGVADFDLFTTEGTTLHPSTAARSVTRPATGESAIAVGAVGDTDNDLEAFSSRGPTVDGRTKPELVGPDGVETSTYGGFSGTSAAAPHAAGVAALVIDSVNKSIGPARLRRSLTESATPLADEIPNNRTGYGLVNATGAVIAAGGTTRTPTLELSPLDAPDAATIGETIRVNVTVTNTGDTFRTADLEYIFNGTVEGSRVVDLDANESIEVRFNTSTDGVASGTYEHGVRIGEQSRTRDITIQQPATFELSRLDAPGKVVVGENVTVNATVTNTGDVEGETEIGYVVDGTIDGTRNVSIPGGASIQVVFKISTANTDPGTHAYGISVDGRSRTVNVTIQRPATFEVSELQVPGEAVAGDALTVKTTVTNVGDVAGTAEVTYLFDGSVSGNRSVAIAGGNSTVVSFNLTTAGIDPGTYQHEVRTGGSSETADVTIQQPATFEVADLQVDAPGYRRVPSDYRIVDGYRKAPSEYLTVAVVPLNGTYRVNATVTNVGDVRGATEIEYVFDGTVVQNRSVTLAGGASTVVRFEITADGAPGRYGHGVRSGESNLTAKIRLNVPPTAAFSASTTEPNALDPVTFDASGSEDLDGDVVTYEWDLDGDGEYDDATGIETDAVFTPAGEVTVGLRVIDDAGGTNTTVTTLTVTGEPTPGPTESTPDPTESTETTDAIVDSPNGTGTATDAPGLPGFGLIVALFGLLAAALLGWGRDRLNGGSYRLRHD